MRTRYHEFLHEDIGSGDITSELVVPAGAKAKGTISAKEDCVLAGVSDAAAVFEELGAKAKVLVEDGTRVKAGRKVLQVSGSARALLAGERLALNLVMRMSGIATLTAELVKRAHRANPKVRVAATRKTTPGFRDFEKRAVVLGGGDPHRSGLDDAILIKDNHIRIAGGVAEALRRARRSSFTKKVEIEVESERDAMIAVEAGADMVMLDNFSPEEAARLYAKVKAKAPDVLVEVSGRIRPENIEAYAPGADIVSVGYITHSARSIDFSMTIEGA